MAKILMVYGSTHGQTAKIVRRMADRLTRDGHRVTVWNADTLPRSPVINGFESFLVAGSVRFGKHQHSIADFVDRYHLRLAASPSAFVSVSGALSSGTAEAEAQARKYADRFLIQTGWRPRLVGLFAGAIAYTRYGLITRWMMQLISRMEGNPTDASRDWEFTDWRAVDRFADALARLSSPAVTQAEAGLALSPKPSPVPG